MRLALLTGAAALSFIGVAGAQAETIYAADPAYVDPAYTAVDQDVVATTPGRVYAVPAPPFGIFTPQYIVTQPTVVVAPPAPAVAPARVIERERVVVTPRGRGIARRERVIERERVVLAPRAPVVREQVVVAPREPEIVTTGSSNSSCFIDLNGFERCY